MDHDNPPHDDDVGYRKPPKASRFKPGQSGNPKGRPKRQKTVPDLLTEELAMRVTLTENGQTTRISKKKLLIRRLVNSAIKGDNRAASLLIGLLQVSNDAPRPDTAATPEELDAEDRALLEGFLERGKR